MKKTTFLLAAITLLSVGLWSCGKDNDDSSTASAQSSVEWVDLGLPSGLLWADRNVGATLPEDPGNYYAWGETETKDVYNWDTYRYGHANNQLTKYCNKTSNGLDGFTDELVVLEACDDAATVNMGGGARIPTKEDWQELKANTISTYTSRNGMNGRLYTAQNGKSIFIPQGGMRWDGEVGYVSEEGYCWSATLSTSYPYCAGFFSFGESGDGLVAETRYLGLPVRAVCPAE